MTSAKLLSDAVYLKKNMLRTLVAEWAVDSVLCDYAVQASSQSRVSSINMSTILVKDATLNASRTWRCTRNALHWKTGLSPLKRLRTKYGQLSKTIFKELNHNLGYRVLSKFSSSGSMSGS